MSLRSTSFRNEFRVYDKVAKRFVVEYPLSSTLLTSPDHDVTFSTGVRDEKGCVIYQGDVVSARWYEDWFDQHGYNFWGFVAYNDRLGAYRVYGIHLWGQSNLIETSNGLDLNQQWEIMGNVFEHPKLLTPP